MALDPGLKIVLEQLAANPGPQLHELPVAQARAFFEQMQLPRPEVKIAAVEDRTIPGPGRRRSRCASTARRASGRSRCWSTSTAAAG